MLVACVGDKDSLRDNDVEDVDSLVPEKKSARSSSAAMQKTNW